MLTLILGMAIGVVGKETIMHFVEKAKKAARAAKEAVQD